MSRGSSAEKIKKYPLDQSRLYKCGSLTKLSEILHLSLEQLKELDSIIKYNHFKTQKKDGKDREITAPDKQLKNIQKRILYLLSKVRREDWLISGERGKSYIDNAKAHKNAKYMVTIDISSFYDNCSREYVYRFYRDVLKMPSDIAAKLADITTYANKIPTGCPTSQLLSYYAYYNMFAELNEMSFEKHGCKFTLYVDDMTFSSEVPFHKDNLIKDVNKILNKYGHKPKRSKIKYYGSNHNKQITGVILTTSSELNVPNRLQKIIVDDTKKLKSKMKMKKKITDNEIKKLNGRVQVARRIDPLIFPEVDAFSKKLIK